MKPELVNDPNLLIETAALPQKENTYQLASLTKIFFARLFDILIVSIPQFLLSYFVPLTLGNWTNVAIVMPTTLIILMLYFFVLPILLKGNTLGKLIFNIRLRSENKTGKIPWYALVAREAYFWLIPWIVSVVTTIIAVLILQGHEGDDTFRFDANLVYNLGYLFFLLWFVVLGISIKVQKQHQAGIDIRFNLYVTEKNPINELKVTKEVKDHQNYDHVALSSMPGNFDENNLNELVNDEEKKFNRSINLSNLDEQPKLKQLKNQQNLIESKSKSKKKGNK